MSDLQDLYQELILDHNKRPRNKRRMEGRVHHAEGHNPLCGDRVTVYVDLDNDVIRDVSFEGGGCAISTASASLLTEALRGKTVDEAHRLFDRFHALVAGDDEAASKADGGPPLGKLAAFEGVRRFPTRVKCAVLAWHTLNAALAAEADDEVVVTTE